MRCGKALEREKARLELALRAVRDAMAAVVSLSTPLTLMLDEAHLLGEIKAIDYALGKDPGGWPHDSWFAFVDARREAILSMLKAGKSYDEILEELNLTEVQARLLVKLDEPDAKN